MRILTIILDTLFPHRCVSCSKKGELFCIECLDSVPQVERETDNWIYALYDYRHPPIKKGLWLLKYKSRKNLAVVFASVLHKVILEELSELSVLENFHKPLLIPIPLSKERYKERGFNQAELIASNLVKLDKNENFKLLTNVLFKHKETLHQALIKNRKERLNNVINSFSIKNENLIKGRNIILIDDITTTGATLNEAKKTLKKAGAKKVIAFAIAH